MKLKFDHTLLNVNTKFWILEPNESNKITTDHYENTTVKQLCQPGQIFKKECNICKCPKDGSEAVCSKNNCAEKEKSKKVLLIFNSNEKKIKYRQYFKL